MQLTSSSRLIDYIRASRLWSSKPEIDLPLKFKFWFVWRWSFAEDLYFVSFENFITASKYRASIEHSHEFLLRIYSPKRFKWLYKRLILAMPIKKILPIYEHYLKEITKIDGKLKEQSEIYEGKDTSKHDMAEFGYTNISYLLAGGNLQQVNEFINKQPVIYIISEYRRKITILENERYLVEKNIRKSKNNL